MRALLIPLVCLVACTTPASKGAMSRLTPKTSEAVTSYSFAGCSIEISAQEQQRLRAHVRSLPVATSDTIVVSVPKGNTPAQDAGRMKTLRQLFTDAPAQVRYIAESGLNGGQCATQGIIRIVRVTSVEIDCRDGASAAGCASARNLAAMMSSPSDLFLPDKGEGYTGGPTGTIIRFEDSSGAEHDQLRPLSR